MRNIRTFAAACSALLISGAITPFAVADPPDLQSKLDAAVAAEVQQLGIPGAVVNLSIPGRINYTTAVGVSDTASAAPMDVANHSRIGSVTKTFTGTAILQLVDQGRIRLADPIAMYVDGVPSGDRITLDMLGRMRSGLFNYSNDETFQDRFYAEAPVGPDAFSTSPQELLDIAFRHPLKFPPGSDYEYSNTNAVLLGLVVERVTGQPLGDYLEQNIYSPLGLTQTTYPTNGLLPEPFSHGYTTLQDGTVADSTFWNPSWASSAGRIVSNLEDMKTWAAALGRGTLLQPDTQAQRIQGQDGDPGLTYGFAIYNSHGWLGHNGDIPGYSTVAVYLPEEDATLVIFANSDVPENINTTGKIATAVTAIVTPDHIYRLD